MSALPAEAFSRIGAEVGSFGSETVNVYSPADGTVIGSVTLADTAAVDRAARAAAEAFPAWAAMPSTKRSRLLIKLAYAISENADELASIITADNGKALADAQAELQRAIEHLEAASHAPALLAGEAVMDVVPGIDSTLLREPLGVAAVVAPFNFPIMTGLIYWSWALACGNTVIIKPSEQAPYAPTRLAELAAEVGFPPGVINIVHGGREAVEALCDHPAISSLSLVGSSATAAAIYQRASAAKKRVHAAGGARNPIVVMPDADPKVTAEGIASSAFAMAGQRCLSGSIMVLVGEGGDEIVDAVCASASSLTVAAGTADTVDVPPLISRAAVEGAVRSVEAATAAGASVLVDGRAAVDPDGGYFFGPTVLAGVQPGSELITSETFGPLLSIVRVATLEDALALVNSSPFGNAASIFTRDGKAAREFTKRADVGNIGVNVGVAAPTANVAFGGRRNSFVGTIHSQGRHAIEFYTDIKSVSTRW